MRDPGARESVQVDFQPLEGSRLGELSATFDIVLGETAQEDEAGKLRGGSTGGCADNHCSLISPPPLPHQFGYFDWVMITGVDVAAFAQGRSTFRFALKRSAPRPAQSQTKP